MSEIKLEIAITNGADKRADRLCEGDAVIQDGRIWQVLDAEFEGEHVVVQLGMGAGTSVTQRLSVPRFALFHVVEAYVSGADVPTTAGVKWSFAPAVPAFGEA